MKTYKLRPFVSNNGKQLTNVYFGDVWDRGSAKPKNSSECQKNDQPLSLEALTNAIFPEDPKKLQKALTADNIQINDGFVPDRRSLKAFVKIRAKTQYWSVEIDRQALVRGQARYDAQKRTLTLTDLPKELEAELKSELNDG